MIHAHHVLTAPAGERSQRPPDRRGRRYQRPGKLSEPVTQPVTEPVTFGDRPAPGSPCKSTPNSPAAVATTRPPRLRRDLELGWSQRPWGWLSISRGNPGPAAAVCISSSDECWKERKKNNSNSSQDERPVAGGFVSEGALGGRR
jgi:hypothetical protein